jgi:hypothetical protein
MYKSKNTSFLRKSTVTNFGRTERITGAVWTTMIDVDIDEQQAWTVNIDTKTITGFGASSGITSKVMAMVEVGSGNAVSTQMFDASDFAQFTIAGDHVKISLTLVSALAYAAPPNGPNFLGIGYPAAAPSTDAALVACFLSSESTIVAPPSLDYPVTPIFGAPGGPTSLSTHGIVSTVPTRVWGFSAFNPSASLLYLNLRSSAVAYEGNSPITLLSTTLLPSQLPIDKQFSAPMPFARGLVWDVSANPDGSSPSATNVRVDIELVRQPSVVLATSIPPIS